MSNTYYLPMTDRLPVEGEPRAWISYYQWLPMILLAQAALFYCPVLIWRGFNGKIGVQTNHLVAAGLDLHDNEKKQKSLTYMIQLMNRYLAHYRDDTHSCLGKIKSVLRNKCNILSGKKYGNYLVVLYMIVKILYLVNCIGQLFLMDAFS